MKSKSIAKPGLTENISQQLVARYLDELGLLWCHVPNGGKRNKKIAQDLKAQGVKAGVPDILIFSKIKNLNYSNKVGLAIELKREKGGHITKHQKKWLNDLAKHGWVTALVHGHDEAIKLINEVYKIYK